MRSTQSFLALVAGLAVAAASPAAFAKETHFSFSLSGKQETPPNDSTATGSGTATYDDATHSFTWNVTFSGIATPTTAAHFHGPAAEGKSAPPTVPLKAPITSPLVGSATLTDAQAQELLAGQRYFNVHSQKDPGGEIRGQVLAK